MVKNGKFLAYGLVFFSTIGYGKSMEKLERGDKVTWIDGYGERMEGKVVQVSASGEVIIVDAGASTSMDFLTMYACEVEKVS